MGTIEGGRREGNEMSQAGQGSDRGESILFSSRGSKPLRLNYALVCLSIIIARPYMWRGSVYLVIVALGVEVWTDDDDELISMRSIVVTTREKI